MREEKSERREQIVNDTVLPASVSNLQKKQKRGTAPLVLWLQGGPGVSSLLGLLVENGPLEFSPGDSSAVFRPLTWARSMSMVYVDQPVGTGFSHSQSGDRGFARSAADAAGDLYEFLGQFFALFPEYLSNDFYIAGESYAGTDAYSIARRRNAESKSSGGFLRRSCGKFVPALARMLNILRYDDSLPKVKGLILSSPYVDPETQVDISELLYQTGFVSEKQASVLRAQFQTVIQLVHRDNFTEAKRVMDTVIDGSWGLPATLFENMTGLRQAFNLDLSTDPPELAAYRSFLERHDVRAALHVGDVPFSDDYSLVQKHMYSDMMTSQARNFGELLDQGIKVLVFGGQKDLLVPFSSVERLMSRLDWKGQLEYKATERTPWMLDHSRVGGYFRQVRNYTEVLIRGAGHMVPFDKPKEVLTLVKKFINNLPIQEAL
ncbi:hypothetical protein HPB47_005525 [Ixodes persulcatus]|uniref:Uncharacterized protein n=1 Tax=Ixodes persulcatus TaxID=34615 RepID=A0AC60PCR5_IXOPE|nr:hypothetical protein HPB47_005525 [Ixodes persulcatus]